MPGLVHNSQVPRVGDSIYIMERGMFYLVTHVSWSMYVGDNAALYPAQVFVKECGSQHPHFRKERT